MCSIYIGEPNKPNEFYNCSCFPLKTYCSCKFNIRFTFKVVRKFNSVILGAVRFTYSSPFHSKIHLETMN